MIKENNCVSEITTSCFRLNSQDALIESRCSDRYEILFFDKGSGKCIVEGVEYKVYQHSILFIKPFSYSCMDTNGDELSGYAIQFDDYLLPDEVKKLLQDISSKEDEHSKFYSSFAMPEHVFLTVEKLSAANEIDESVRQIYSQSLLTEIISLLSISRGEEKNYNEDELGARVARYLNRNIDKNISLDKLAGRFFVSKYYLCRAFKKYSGVSVHAYINQKRILYAKQLIESGVTASVAAYKVGYGDYSAFYRAYKKIVGKSPVRE